VVGARTGLFDFVAAASKNVRDLPRMLETLMSA
jgi:hypothetical protein